MWRCATEARSPALHGTAGQLDAVTLKSGERLRFSYLLVFLGALPCTEWLGDTVKRDANGFILTGADIQAGSLLVTSFPGVFAPGDVRSGRPSAVPPRWAKGRGFSSSTPISLRARCGTAPERPPRRG